MGITLSLSAGGLGQHHSPPWGQHWSTESARAGLKQKQLCQASRFQNSLWGWLGPAGTGAAYASCFSFSPSWVLLLLPTIPLRGPLPLSIPVHITALWKFLCFCRENWPATNMKSDFLSNAINNWCAIFNIQWQQRNRNKELPGDSKSISTKK